MVNFNKILHITKRELKSFFYSPVAYIFICIFLVALGWLFFSKFFLYNQLEMREFFNILPIVLSFVIPAITMGLFAEEFSSGSYEVISTTSVSGLDIIIGKFIGAVVFMIIALFPTIIYPVFLVFLGELDLGPIFGGYIGAIFLISALVTIGIFASSLSKSQIVSFIISLSISVTLCLLLGLMKSITPPFIVDLIDYFSFSSRFSNIAKGILDLRDIAYFIASSVVFLFLTYQNLEYRKIG
ncbi:MAG: hypothetical protein N2258_00235 [Brevinematales bacterium]|nr:hypothetical protein [Brevinematales bacterium]